MGEIGSIACGRESSLRSALFRMERGFLRIRVEQDRRTRKGMPFSKRSDVDTGMLPAACDSFRNIATTKY